jgi:GNAT superfamily N-acetyltransferase
LTGAEKIIGKVLAKGGLKPDASRIGNIIKNGITEAAPEFIQAAQEKFASNLALQREGVDVSLTQGVFSQGALEGLVGLGMGVGAGAIEPRIQTEPTKEEVSAAASETQDVARRSMDVAPATASLVEGEAEQIIQSQAETPDQRVARLEREAQEGVGIDLEEEVPVSGLPPVEPTPPVTPAPDAAVAPVEPAVPVEGAVEPTAAAAPTEPTATEPVPVVTPRPAVDVEALSPNAKRANRILANTGVDPETAAFVAQQYQDEIADLGGEELRAFVLDKFEENGGVIPAQMRYSEDQEYYELAFGIGPEEAATLVENAKGQNTQMAQAELEQNKQWRRKDGQQITETQQGVAVAQPEAQAVPLTAGEVPPSPAIEGRRVPLTAPEAAVTPTPVAPTPVTPEVPTAVDINPAQLAAQKESLFGKVDPQTQVVDATGRIVPRYMWHSPPSGLKQDQGVVAYVSREEGAQRAIDESFGSKDVKTVWLGKFGRDKGMRQGAFTIDLAKLDPANIMYTGQAEGNVWYRGDIPESAINRSGIDPTPTPEPPSPQPEARESRRAITPQQDRDYLDAVERGDYKTAQRILDSGFPPLPEMSQGLKEEMGYWLNASNESGNVMPSWLALKDLMGSWGDRDSVASSFKKELQDIGIKLGYYQTISLEDAKLRASQGLNLGKGYDFKRGDKYYIGDGETPLNIQPTETRDEGGNIIPPSQRFAPPSMRGMESEPVTAGTVITSQQDREYLDLARQGNISATQEKINNIVAEAAIQEFFNAAYSAGDAPSTLSVDLMNANGVLSLESISIDPEERGRNFGSRAINLLVRIADKYGIPIELQVGADEAQIDLVRFYEKRGFEFVGGAFMRRNPASEIEPIVRDNAGNIIPPSQRFQQGEADIRYARTERDPEVQKAAQDLKAGTIDRDEYQRIVDMRMPLRKFEAVPTPANNEDMLRGLGERKAGERLKKDLIQNPEAIAEGTVLESRLDIPAYENENVWVVSLHEPRPNINKGNAGPVVAYTPTSVLRNVEFGVTEKAAVGIAAGKPKSTIATMKGEFVPMTAEQAYELANTNKEQWVEIGMNPVRHSYFYDKDTQTPVVSAEEVVQVGGMVLAKNPVFGKKEDYLYSLAEAAPTVGMTTDGVRARLEALGFGVEGMIRIVEDPQAAFEGRTIIQDGKAVRIELNASALNDDAAIDRVLNHEFAEAANADGALNKLVERLTPKEKKEINDAITRLGYEERVRTTEEAARAIEALAAGWKGRGFFERAVARVEAWGSKLGLKLTRRAAEYIAARNLSDINAGFKAAYNQSINTTTESREARRDYQADADSYKINDLSKIRKVLNLSNIEDGIVKFLSRDLLDAKWAKIPVANDATTHGHCWVAAEAAYHVLGGKGKDWEHRTLNNKGWPKGLDAGETHHFIQNKKTGEIIDPTRSQFGNVSIPYGNSIFGGAFMGKTAESPSIRAKALLHRIAAGEPRVEIRESRREPAPTFTEESPEAKTLSNLKASMEKVDAASEAKGGKPETQKVSEIAANWMEQGGDERALQDAITENTNLSPVNAAKVAKVIARQYDKQQQIAEAVLETEAGVTLEGLPEGMEIPKDVDPKNKRTVLQRVIDATTGVRVKPVILQVPEKTALKEQIRLKARETREAKKAQQETADAVVEAIKALELRGPMRAKQAQALAKRAAKVLWTSEKSMENFIAYAERVMANTNYDADLREAKAAQKRAKELSKRDSIAAPQRETLEAIGNIGINLLNDPREFADVVNHYLRSFKPVVSEAYVVVPDAEMKSYLAAAEDVVNDAKAEFEIEDNERLADKYGITIDELKKYMDAEEIMDALVKYAKREVIEGILNEKSAGVKEALKGVDTTILRADQRKLIDSMKVIDVKSLDAAEKQAYIRIGNNIIFNNNQTNGAEFFVATAKGQQAARDLAKNTEAMTKNKAWSNIVPALGSRRAKKVLKAWAEDLQSVADTFRNAFGKEAMTVFYEAMGMVDLDLGFTNAARTLEEIQSKMEKFYKKLDNKYKGAATNQDGILSEGIVGYLIQNVPEKGEADSLAQRRGLLQQDIIERRKSGDEDRMQMADRIQELMQKLDGETVDQILVNLKREYPANYESLTWLKDELFPQYKDFLKQFDENFNDQANNYNTPNYLPIVYSNISPSIDLLQGKKKYYDSLSSAPKQSSYTIKRSDYTQLPLGDDGRKPKEIGLNLRRNAYNSLSDQITRAYTNPARQRIYSFLKTPESEEALGGAANRDFFAERIERLMESRERRGSFNKNTFEKAVDVLANLGRDIGTRIALAGSYQLIRQPADQVTVAIGVTGRADLMAKHLDPRQIKAARPVIDLFSIGRRGDASSGYKYINQMEGAQSRLERYYTEGNWVKAKEAAKNFADKFMAPLKVSDFTVAAATWMTFYRAYLAKNGIRFTTWEDAANLIESDDVGHKRAAAYAENMTDIYQGSSDPTKMAVFAQKGKTGPENLLKAILVPFNSFGVQFRSRISSELTEIFTRSGDWRGKAVAVKDLGATIGGTIMFGLAKRFVLPAITLGGVNILYSIFGVDVEEPDEEKKKEEFELKWRQLQGDIVSTMIVGGGGQMLESYTIDGMNYMKYMIDSANGSEDVLDDNGEVMSFNKYAKERAPFYRYRSFDNAMSLGILDIGMDQAKKSILNTKMVLTPEEMDKYTPEEQRFLLVALISDWLYLGGFNDADFARMWDKGRRDMINARKEEEKALKKIREGR